MSKRKNAHAVFDCFVAHRDGLLLLNGRGCTHLMPNIFHDRLADV